MLEINAELVQQLALKVVDVEVDQFLELFNILNDSKFESLSDIINNLKQQKLQNYLQSLLKEQNVASASTHVSIWDRNTVEGKHNASLASKRSVAKRKAREACPNCDWNTKSYCSDHRN
jgi:formate dehydrogenase maturation protein FdhE